VALKEAHLIRCEASTRTQLTCDDRVDGRDLRIGSEVGSAQQGKALEIGARIGDPFGRGFQCLVEDLPAEFAIAVDPEPDLALQFERAKDCLIRDAG